MNTAPSRRTSIRDALRQLSTSEFQTLGVEFVRLQRRGVHIDWMALNDDGSPGKGQPDGRIRLASGRMIDVEVSKGAAWHTKIETDLQAIAKRGRDFLEFTDELVFVTSNEVNLRKDDATLQREAELRAHAVSLLDPPDVPITFLHLNSLVEELVRPEYAQFVRRSLSLRIDPSPFRTVSDHLGVAGKGQQWLVDSAAFHDGLVRVPEELLSRVEKTLASDREILISGHGASGKTTLALMLGVRAEKQDRVALYLDFTKADRVGRSDVIDALLEHAADGAVVILDNVQAVPLAELEELRSEVRFRQDESSLPSFSVIYVSRAMEGGDWGRAATSLPKLQLTVDSAWLECVFDFVKTRVSAERAAAFDDEARRKWCADPSRFGHDLVVFSIALASNRKVSDYLREEYFDRYDREQKEALLTLASISQFGVMASPQALGDAQPLLRAGRDRASYQARGVVQLATTDRYVTFHPSFAILLLRAAGPALAESLAERLKESIRREPSLSSALFAALGREFQENAQELSRLREPVETQAIVDAAKALRKWLANDPGMMAEVLLVTAGGAWSRLIAEVFAEDARGREAALQPVLERLFAPSFAPRLLASMRNRRLDDVATLASLLPPANQTLLLQLLIADDLYYADQVVRGGCHPAMALLTFLRTLKQPEAPQWIEITQRIIGSESFADRAVTDHPAALIQLLIHLEKVTDPLATAAWQSIVKKLSGVSLVSYFAGGQTPLRSCIALFRYFSGREDEDSKSIAKNAREYLERHAPALAEPHRRRLGATVELVRTLEPIVPDISAAIRAKLATLPDLRNTFDGHLSTFHAVIDYLLTRDTPEDLAIARRIRQAMLSDDIAGLVKRSRLEHLMSFFQLLSRDPEDPSNELLISRMVDALTEEDLVRRMVSVPITELAGAIGPLLNARETRATDVKLAERLRKALRAPSSVNRFASALSSGVGDGASADTQVRALIEQIVRFDGEAGRQITDQWLSTGSEKQLERWLAERPFEENVSLLRFLAVSRPELAERVLDQWSGMSGTLEERAKVVRRVRQYSELIQRVLATRSFSAESLLAQATNADIVPLKEILFTAKLHAPELARRLVEGLPRHVDLNAFYDHRSSWRLFLFLGESWLSAPTGGAYQRLYNQRLAVAARATLKKSRDAAEPRSTLVSALGLCGMLSKFRAAHPSRYRAAGLPDVNECDDLFQSGHIEGDLSAIAVIFGMRWLRLRLSPPVAATVLGKLRERRASLANVPAGLALAYDEVERWLTLCVEDRLTSSRRRP